MKLLGLLLSVLFASVPLQAGAASMAGNSMLDVNNQTQFYVLATMYGETPGHEATWCVFPEKNAAHQVPFTIKDVVFQVKRSCNDSGSFATRKMGWQPKYVITKVKLGYIFR